MTTSQHLELLLQAEHTAYTSNTAGMTLAQVYDYGSEHRGLAQSIVHELTPCQVRKYGYLVESMDTAHHEVFKAKMDTYHTEQAAAYASIDTPQA